MSFLDQLSLDSRDRKAISNSTTDYVMDIPKSNVQANVYKLVKIIIPLVYDNLTSSNNTITTPSVTIPVGHYNISNLVAELNDQTVGFYTWSWERNERIKVLKDDLATFTFDGGTANALLGVDTTVSHAGANTYTFELLPDLAEGFNYLVLHSILLSSRSQKELHLSNQKGDALQIIPLQRYEHGQRLTYEPHEPVLFNVKHQNISSIDFQLRDKNYNIVDLGNQTIEIVIDRMS